MKVECILPYGPKVEVLSDTVGKSMTKQNHKDECDVNQILAKFQRTGAMTHVRERSGEYMDVDPVTYKEAMDIAAAAQTMFADLPSALRDYFGNDPEAFLEYTQNPQNADSVKSGFKEILDPEGPTISPAAGTDAVDQGPEGTPSAAQAAAEPAQGDSTASAS